MGGKNSVLKLKKYIFPYLLYKTTPKNTWASSLSPILRKMEEIVPPPYLYQPQTLVTLVNLTRLYLTSAPTQGPSPPQRTAASLDPWSPVAEAQGKHTAQAPHASHATQAHPAPNAPPASLASPAH